MNIAIYILLGFCDAAAVLYLMFRLYRFPIWEYKLELSVLALWISFMSFIIRMAAEIPAIDPIAQFLVFTLFLRYVIKVRAGFSALIVLTGLATYIITQMAVLYGLTAIDISSIADATKIEGAGTYFIQIGSIITAFVIGTVMKVFNRGFSFIIRPPHDVHLKDRNSKANARLWFSVATVLAALSFAFFLMLHYNSILVIPILIVSFLILYCLSYRRERMNSDRIHFPPSSNQDTRINQ